VCIIIRKPWITCSFCIMLLDSSWPLLLGNWYKCIPNLLPYCVKWNNSMPCYEHKKENKSTFLGRRCERILCHFLCVHFRCMIWLSIWKFTSFVVDRNVHKGFETFWRSQMNFDQSFNVGSFQTSSRNLHVDHESSDSEKSVGEVLRKKTFTTHISFLFQHDIVMQCIVQYM